jgi:hypothetical protein
MYEHMTGSHRIAWSGLPSSVAAAVGRALGSRIVSADSQPGGFSEGLAARVRLADGRRAFVKAASSAVAAFHRREARVAEALAPTGLVPRLLHVYDDGTWVALVFEEVAGHLPAQPWQRPELERVLSSLTTVADALTPSPVSPEILALPRLGGWRELAESAARHRSLALGKQAPGEPAPLPADLDRLVALEDQAATVLAGDTLLHGDLYPFNLLLTPDRVVAVDWPHAWIGAAFCDALTLMSSASLSGIDPQSLADRHPLTRDLDPRSVNVFLAVHAGFLLRVATSAGPATDPRLVAMMNRLGTASLTWLRRRW